MRCRYIHDWMGQCPHEAQPNQSMCVQDAEKVCVVCSKPATHSCAQTIGGFVCGSALCDHHEHDVDRTMALAHK